MGAMTALNFSLSQKYPLTVSEIKIPAKTQKLIFEIINWSTNIIYVISSAFPTSSAKCDNMKGKNLLFFLFNQITTCKITMLKNLIEDKSMAHKLEKIASK